MSSVEKTGREGRVPGPGRTGGGLTGGRRGEGGRRNGGQGRGGRGDGGRGGEPRQREPRRRAAATVAKKTDATTSRTIRDGADGRRAMGADAGRTTGAVDEARGGRAGGDGR